MATTTAGPIYERSLLLQTALTLLFLLLIQYLTVKIYRTFIYPYCVSPLRHLPGPKDHVFLLGQDVNQFRSGCPNEPYLAWMRTGPTAPLIRYFTFGNSEALLVTSLAAHREILQTKCYSFTKPKFFVKLIGDIVGLGLVFAAGEEHKKQRKAPSGLFSYTNIKSYVPLFRRKAEELAGLFDKAIGNDGGIIEVASLYSRVNLDIIGLFALGIDLKYLDRPSTFHHCYHEVFEPTTFGAILTALNGFISIRWLPIEANRSFLRTNKVELQSVDPGYWNKDLMLDQILNAVAAVFPRNYYAFTAQGLKPHVRL
ncbi:Cytochrome P450 [Pleurostoma richardsiae]|uniref:Cytochrome P450 n=1 Tax=Pleurostoma richardsiae TaxID=41990 RepID=A0AA38RRP2_9PEZI|nr:Cytochrome P450 [Pleurostoma richardsiae]